MAKLTLNAIGSRYGSIDALNDNFDAIEQALENTLSRDGTSPNALEADLDMNGNQILNASTINASTLIIGGQTLEPGDAVASATVQVFEFTATAGQTSFSVSPLTPASSSVLMEVNGLSLPTSSLVTSGSILSFPALSLNDEVVVKVFTREIGAYPAITNNEVAANAAIVSTKLAFTQAGTTQVRSVQDKLRDVVSVKDFGAVGNGVTDDTVAIQAAINYVGTTLGKGQVYIPVGTYKLTSALTLLGGIHLSGDGYNLSSLVQYSINSQIIYVPSSSMSCTLSGLGLSYAVTANDGVPAIRWDGGNGFLNNFSVNTCNIGVEVTAIIWMAQAFTIGSYKKIGLYVHDCNDVFIDNFIIEAGTSTNGTLGGIRLFNKVEAFIATNGDILNGLYGLTCDATSNTARVRPQANKFTNVYFDSAKNNNVLLNNTVDCDFTNCWFSFAGYGTVASTNVYLQNCDSIRFNGGQNVTAGAHGFVIEASCKRMSITGMRIAENSGVTSNVYDGISIVAGTTDFIIQGNTFNNVHLWQTAYNQRYGVIVNTGASDRYIIADNLVTGNATGGVSDGGSGSNKRVANNY